MRATPSGMTKLSSLTIRLVRCTFDGRYATLCLTCARLDRRASAQELVKQSDDWLPPSKSASVGEVERRDDALHQVFTASSPLALSKHVHCNLHHSKHALDVTLAHNFMGDAFSEVVCSFNHTG